jgi:hypothetical protein
VPGHGNFSWGPRRACPSGLYRSPNYILAGMAKRQDPAPLYSGVRLTEKIGIGVLTRLVTRDLVDEILIETGRTEQRSRLLPARVVVYFVMACNLFFGDGYEEVMRRLVGGLQFLGTWRRGWAVPTTGAMSQARARLGEAPMKALFERVATPMARPGTVGAWYRSLRVMAIDGVVLDVPDTAANAEAFGRSGNALAASPFPQVRVVALTECGTHAVVAASIGVTKQYERELAGDLFSSTSPGMLLLADRGFFGYDLWKEARAHGADLLWRVKAQNTLPVLEAYPDGSYRSALLPKRVRADLAKGKRRHAEHFEIPVRVIEYQVTKHDTGDASDTGDTGEGEVIRLVTSLTDHETAPAAELAALYQQRWEIELAFDEIETHQTGRPRVLRSKSPELVRQEIWALFLTHYAIRHLMREAADDIDIDPDRLSFMRSLRVIRRQVTDQAAFSPRSPE